MLMLRRFLPALLVLALFGLAACSPSDAGPAEEEEEAAEALPAVTVYKSPTCGCCAEWVEHMEENGFEVKTSEMINVTPMKNRLGVPGALRSCHTSVIGGYVVEGHVPADVIKTMLGEEPDFAGLAVPGMPIGSPGMEVEGRPDQPYSVLAFDGQGRQSVYARENQ